MVAGADKELQELIYDCWSQDVTAGAKMWMQEHNVAAELKMWLQDTRLKSSFLFFCPNFRFFQIHGLSEPLYLVLFLLGANLNFSDPWY